MPEIVIPTVHLNGTSSHDLIAQLHEAARALSKAADALAKAAPNARDYYPQGEGVFEKAAAAYRDRIARIKSCYTEVSAIHEAVEEQVEAAKARKF